MDARRKKDLKRLSKFMSLVLRHKADQFGIAIDEEGFAELAAIRGLIKSRFGGRFAEADIEQVSDRGVDGKRRFEIRGDRIRALYGHSQVRPILYHEVEPPEVLFHGTNASALPGIRESGLESMGRQYVHLSTTIERASQVGSRRTRAPVILRVRAAEAHAAGIVFHCPEPLHYLAKSIPAEFIDFD